MKVVRKYPPRFRGRPLLKDDASKAPAAKPLSPSRVSASEKMTPPPWQGTCYALRIALLRRAAAHGEHAAQDVGDPPKQPRPHGTQCMSPVESESAWQGTLGSLSRRTCVAWGRGGRPLAPEGRGGCSERDGEGARTVGGRPVEAVRDPVCGRLRLALVHHAAVAVDDLPPVDGGQDREALAAHGWPLSASRSVAASSSRAPVGRPSSSFRTARSIASRSRSTSMRLCSQRVAHS